MDAIADAVAVASHGLPGIVPDPHERAAVQAIFDAARGDVPAPAPALEGSPTTMKIAPAEAVPPSRSKEA